MSGLPSPNLSVWFLSYLFVCKKSTPLWEWAFNEPMQTDYGGFPCQHG